MISSTSQREEEEEIINTNHQQDADNALYPKTEAINHRTQQNNGKMGITTEKWMAVGKFFVHIIFMA